MNKIFNSISDLPDSVRNRLTVAQQRVWLRVFNRTFRNTNGSESAKEGAAFRAANGVVRNMGKATDFEKRVSIDKTDDEQRMVWGWAYLCQDENGDVVVDHSGDVVDLADIQKAAQDFMMESRTGGQMHQDQAGFVCQSVVVTDEVAAELGLTTLKRGWLIGFKVTDDDAWEGVKSGRFKMFSIGGTAQTEDIGDAEAA